MRFTQGRAGTAARRTTTVNAQEFPRWHATNAKYGYQLEQIAPTARRGNANRAGHLLRAGTSRSSTGDWVRPTQQPSGWRV